MIQALLEATKHLSVLYAQIKGRLQLDDTAPTSHVLTQESGDCTISVMDGSSTNIFYNPTNQTINYVVTIPDGGYFAVGYGTNMLKTDMVLWLASGSNSSQLQLYSETADMPEILSSNSYVTSFEPLIATTQFVTSRFLQPT